MRYQPSVQMGEPKDKEKYNHYSVDGLDVYVVKGTMAVEDTMRVKLAKFLWNEVLTVEGMIH
ncbi:MAG: CC/Se motif family (seleno)protein [Tissierellia bacterium]|nr:CC/Se motif family (seleno)protein [Tissierellia bacterium]